MSKNGIIEELHRLTRRNFLRRKTVVKGYGDLWQSDLADMQKYADDNEGYRYILIVIDCYSKYVWAKPLRNKTGVSVRDAFLQILESATYHPKNIQTDLGTEFYNKYFKQMVIKYGINLYSTYSTKKASMAERVIRTIKTGLFKQFSKRGKYRWIDIISDIVKEYNNTKHSATNTKPVDVRASTLLNQRDEIKQNVKLKRPKFNIGDVVRISKYKSVFEKGYTANYTTELFKINKINSTYPVTYYIEDMKGHPIKGCFYEMELLKTKFKDIYLVEKIIRRRGNKVLVKWLGFPQEENSWIAIKDVV